MKFFVIIDPDHPRARNNIKWYEDLLAEEGVKQKDYRRNIPPVTNPRPMNGLHPAEHDIYEALCRNEVPVVIFCILHKLKRIILANIWQITH